MLVASRLADRARGGDRRAAGRRSAPTSTPSGLVDGDELPDDLRRSPGADDVRATFQKLTLLRPSDDRRVLVVGLGKPGDLDAGAAAGRRRARGRRGRPLRRARRSPGQLPRIRRRAPRGSQRPPWSRARSWPRFRFDRFKSRDPDDPPPARARAPGDRGRRTCRGSRRRGRAARGSSAEAANRARELQSLPVQRRHARATSPSARARSPPPTRRSAVEVLGRAEIERPRHGRAGGRRQGQRRGAAADRAALRGRRRRARRSASSARRSPSTPAGSRSSPRRRWRR